MPPRMKRMRQSRAARSGGGKIEWEASEASGHSRRGTPLVGDHHKEPPRGVKSARIREDGQVLSRKGLGPFRSGKAWEVFGHSGGGDGKAPQAVSHMGGGEIPHTRPSAGKTGTPEAVVDAVGGESPPKLHVGARACPPTAVPQMAPACVSTGGTQ